MTLELELEEFSHEKKGMSPLIATVLLIAFAVALGAMIMNWGSSLGESTGPDCSNIIMQVNPYLCYAENMIRMSIKNTGDPVKGLAVRVIDEIRQSDMTIKESALKKGETLKRDIPFVKSGKTYISLIPLVEYKGEATACPEPVIEIDDLPLC